MLWSLSLIMRKTKNQKILGKKVYSNILNQNIENVLYLYNLEAERMV